MGEKGRSSEGRGESREREAIRTNTGGTREEGKKGFMTSDRWSPSLCYLRMKERREKKYMAGREKMGEIRETSAVNKKREREREREREKDRNRDYSNNKLFFFIQYQGKKVGEEDVI